MLAVVITAMTTLNRKWSQKDATNLKELSRTISAYKFRNIHNDLGVVDQYLYLCEKLNILHYVLSTMTQPKVQI